MKKTIIILAKSIKKSNYCIAGIDKNTGEWIRPISNNPNIEKAVPYNIKYSNGDDIELLDIAEIDLLKNEGNIIQPENYYYNESIKWTKIGKAKLEDVFKIHPYDDEQELIYYNFNRCIDENEINFKNHKSLLLINANVAKLKLVIKYGKKKRKMDLKYKGINYTNFAVTDYKYDINDYLTNKTFENVTLLISLTDKFEDNKYYKIIATIFE